MKKTFPFILSISIVLLFSIGCSRHKNSQEAYIGNWKVTEPTGETYFMSLREDGSSSSTFDGGEFGKWQMKEDHIEIEWTPKTLKLYFNPGSTKPLLENPTQINPNPTPSVAEKVEKVP